MSDLRLSHSKEFNIMLPETNRKNLDSYVKLLPDFYYDYRTRERIQKTLKHLTRPWKENWLDSKLNLNSQRRAFYHLPVKPEYDKAFKLYCKILNRVQDKCELFNADDGFNPIWANPKQREVIDANPSLFSYDTFRSNKLKLSNGTEAKLFKFLIKKNLLTTDEAQAITTKKAGLDDMYFCVSRNPIDYIFASTGQPFTSCISLDSTYEEAAFMGLGALSVDPNRALMMITKGKVKNRTLKGKPFRYLRMVSRSWGILYSNNQMLVVGTYPHTNIPYQDVLSGIDTKEIRVISDYPREASSKFHWEPTRYEDGNKAMIYLDGGSPIYAYGDGSKTMWRYDTSNGHTGTCRSFSCGMDFENICSWEDLENGGILCYECGDPVDEDYANYVDGDYYCEYCFDQNFVHCYTCGDPVYRDDAYYVEEEYDVCSRCYSNYYRTCEFCGEPYHEDNIINTEDDYTVCSYCLKDATTKCTDCGAVFYDDSNLIATEHSLICEGCRDENYDECIHCGEIYLIDYNSAVQCCAGCESEEAVNE